MQTYFSPGGLAWCGDWLAVRRIGVFVMNRIDRIDFI